MRPFATYFTDIFIHEMSAQLGTHRGHGDGETVHDVVHALPLQLRLHARLYDMIFVYGVVGCGGGRGVVVERDGMGWDAGRQADIRHTCTYTS